MSVRKIKIAAVILFIYCTFFIFWYMARLKESDLFSAAATGDYDKVISLMESGVDIDAKGHLYNSAVHFAAKNGHLEIVVLLHANYADIYEQNYEGDTPLTLAAKNGHIEIVDYLVANNADLNNIGGVLNEPNAPLSNLAASGEHPEIVKLLIKKGAKIDVRHEGGYTPLMRAAYHGNIDMIKILIDGGAEINAINEYGDTALMLAASNGHREVEEILIDAGAKKPYIDPDKMTLVQAIRYNDINAIDTILLTGNVDLNKTIKDWWREDDSRTFCWTPLMLAAVKGNKKIVNRLILRGAPLNAESCLGEGTALTLISGKMMADLETVKTLIEYGIDLNAGDYYKNTPLITAAAAGNFKLVKLLIESGADITLKNIRYDDDNVPHPAENALIAAAMNGHIEILEYLVENGAYVDSYGLFGFTPIMLAELNAHPQVVEYFRRKGKSLPDRYSKKRLLMLIANKYSYEHFERGLFSLFMILFFYFALFVVGTFLIDRFIGFVMKK